MQRDGLLEVFETMRRRGIGAGAEGTCFGQNSYGPEFSTAQNIAQLLKIHVAALGLKRLFKAVEGIGNEEEI